jgi:endonuclease I
MKRLLSSIFLFLLVVCATAQKEYYTSVDGVKGGEALKTALYNLIKNHKVISYGSGESSTWGAFYTTDAAIENGQRRVLDMYSNEKRYFGSKGSAVSGMNIEHSVAKSWWGGTKNNAYCDIHHLNPSDATANSRKSNYPLGELTSVSWDNGVTFVGKANIDGSSQNAYEPCDEYKGDFARVFMYMFTCYQDLTWKYTWMNYANSTYPTLKPWAVKLLLKWHKQDPVSEKEVNRNNAVYAVQGNRNPYVDYPQLADYVWGDSINYVFHLTGEVEDGTGGGNGGNTDGGNDGSDDVEIIDGWKIYLNENFDGTSMKFTTYEGIGDYPWQLNSQYKYAVATSYVSSSKTNHNAESWLLSPSFDFSNDSIATVSFDYVIRYCESGKAAEHHTLIICNDFDGDVENATWETIGFNATENTTDWTLTKTGDIEIPQKYMGEKAVTIAFFYKGTETKAGTFEIDNVIVKAIEGANDGGNTGSGDGDGEDNGDNGENGDDDNENNEGNDGNFCGGQFVLVTDAAQLTVGDSIVIGYENYAMGQSAGNYRYKTDMMTSGGVITYLADDVQIILLEEGVVEGTYAFNVGNGYLAASSSSSNYVATSTTLDANGSWKIVINDGLAVITAQGDKSRNILQYNTSSPRFSCYKGTQQSVNIYAKSPVASGIEDVKTEPTVDASQNGEVKGIFDLAGRRLNAITEPGIYIVNGKKILVK